MEYDPIKLALVQNRLDHISQQMGWVMVRTARSPIFQIHDFSCFITDPAGQVVSQADGVPAHTGSGGFGIRSLLKAFSDIKEGDVFLFNDPYLAGGNHLPDWVIARPAYFQGTLIGFTCNRAHQSDIGGGAAGTYNPTATEIFHEGVRLPPLRLIEQGRLREDLWRLLLANTRTPDLLDGDLRAMLGSTQIGAEAICELFDELGLQDGFRYLEGILDYADRRFRAEIAALPDGVYVAEETSNTDCFESKTVRYRVTIEVSGDQVSVDLSGTSDQIRGFKNSSIANTHTMVYIGLVSFLDPDLPKNEGTYRSIRLKVPYGSTLNPRPPAATTFCTAYPAHDVIQACWKALAQAAPEKAVAGWGKTIVPISSGDQNGSTWVLYHWNGSPSGGAVAGRDGLPQISVLSTLGGMSVPNAEIWERLYPILVRKQEFRQDGGGAGEWRGGTGIDYEVDVLTPAEYSFRGEGLFDSSGFGAEGGLPGASGELTATGADGIPILTPQYGLMQLPAAHLALRSPGGGGLGNPMDRTSEAVLRDVRDGVVSRQAAREIYGVAVTDDMQVDTSETARLRNSNSGLDRSRAP